MKYFLTVARYLSVTRAAAELHVSEQALSKHILKLEKEMNLELLLRRKKKLVLTEAGECFASYAQKILAWKAQMVCQLSDVVQNRESSIRIGITRARSPVYLPCLLPKFCEEFPDVKIKLTEADSDVLFNQLQNDKLDLVIGIEPHDKLNFASVPLCIEDYAIMAVPEVLKKFLSTQELLQLKEHPEHATLQSFKRCPFLSVDSTRRIGRIFQAACKEAGFKPNVIVESVNLTTLINLCALGVGVLICPRVCLEIAKKQSNIFNKVCVFPVTNIPIQTQITLTTQHNWYPSKLTRAFVRIAKEEFKLSTKQSHNDTEFIAF